MTSTEQQRVEEIAKGPLHPHPPSRTSIMSLIELAERVDGLHEKLARSHPSLERGRVWCTTCGHSQHVDSAVALRHSWPKHCGYTMTIDSPEERAALRARAQQTGERQ